MDDFLALLDKQNIDTDARGLDSYTQNDIPTFDVSIFDDFHAEASNLEDLVVLGFSEIKTDKDNKEAVKISSQIKQLIKAIENERKSAKEPFQKVVRLIDGTVKELRDKLDSIQSQLNIKIKNYLEEQQRLIIERMAINGSNETNDNTVTPEILPAITITESGATAKLQTKKEWRIMDFSRIPFDIYLERSDEVKKALAPAINKRIKAGITEIAGVEFYETTTLKTN